MTGWSRVCLFAALATLLADAAHGDAVGRMPARATGFPFEKRARAIAGHRTKSARFLLLNGSWAFSFVRDARDVPYGFQRTDHDVSGWGTIMVPGDWRAAGFDRPCAATAEHCPSAAPDPVGLYRRVVTIPPEWTGQDVILHLGAAGPAYRVWVNGRAVGGSDDATLPGEFDVSRFVRAGRNLIAIRVGRDGMRGESPASSCRTDAGIMREVFLMAAPPTRIRDLFVHAGLSGDGRDGLLAIDVAVTKGAVTEARYVLMDGDRTVLQGRRAVPGGRGERRATLTGRLAGVRPWAAETPNLYFLLVELYDARGAIIQSTYQRIGFRTVRLRDGAMMVNGRAVPLRNAVRPDADRTAFRPDDRDRMERDIVAMKQAGITMLRTGCHPQDPYLYELADRYGLYVADGAAVGGGLARSVAVRRVTDMIARDRNHPSIILWSADDARVKGLWRAARARDAGRPFGTVNAQGRVVAGVR